MWTLKGEDLQAQVKMPIGIVLPPGRLRGSLRVGRGLRPKLAVVHLCGHRDLRSHEHLHSMYRGQHKHCERRCCSEIPPGNK